jgi:hypothetical protein
VFLLEQACEALARSGAGKVGKLVVSVGPAA